MRSSNIVLIRCERKGGKTEDMYFSVRGLMLESHTHIYQMLIHGLYYTALFIHPLYCSFIGHRLISLLSPALLLFIVQLSI